jgi:hypothetical protein
MADTTLVTDLTSEHQLKTSVKESLLEQTNSLIETANQKLRAPEDERRTYGHVALVQFIDKLEAARNLLEGFKHSKGGGYRKKRSTKRKSTKKRKKTRRRRR